MLTEEDTFNALKRTPFDIVDKGVFYVAKLGNVDAFLLSHGWTLQEYRDEWRNRIAKLTKQPN